ncbi:MAG TPA: NAD(P)/FAD-dependent oxidoreductase [Chthoniobacterales bacterium]|jgi:geranylgeranyl reductase family protein
MWDVAIVGGGPAGASCAAFCAMSGVRTLVIERAKFPREKVCGDCLNPTCWPVLKRLGVAEELRAMPHGRMVRVNFIDLRGRVASAPLPGADKAQIAIRRSIFDKILLRRAQSLGAEVREEATLVVVRRENESWYLEARNFSERARLLVAADGRNSTVARLLKLMPGKGPDRVALQTHLPLPLGYDNQIVMQLLSEGYSGAAPVGEELLNLCLVSRPNDMSRVKSWAEDKFAIAPDHHWRAITPLVRAALPAGRPGLFLVGDAARVVEPFTGEGIYYALRSGELAADAIRTGNHRDYAAAHRRLYRGRLWINSLARRAVEHPRLTTSLLAFLPNEKQVLRYLTGKVVRSV